jgi:hypothetical protein
MGKQAVVVLYVLAMVAVVVGVDILFLRHQLWLRLIVNIGIVLVFGAFYVRFLKRPSARPPQAGLPDSTANPRSALVRASAFPRRHAGAGAPVVISR